jgi:hypothetical protein
MTTKHLIVWGLLGAAVVYFVVTSSSTSSFTPGLHLFGATTT